MNFIEQSTTVSMIYTEQSVLNLNQTYTYEVSKFMHTYSTNRNPVAFNNYFVPILHTHNTRNSENHQFALPQPRTNYGKRSICYNGILTWSKIPQDIKIIPGLQRFKSEVRHYIVQNIE